MLRGRPVSAASAPTHGADLDRGERPSHPAPVADPRSVYILERQEDCQLDLHRRVKLCMRFRAGLRLVPETPWPSEESKWPVEQQADMAKCPIWLVIVNTSSTIDKSIHDLGLALDHTPIPPRSLVIFGRDCDDAEHYARLRHRGRIEVYEWQADQPTCAEIESLVERLLGHVEPPVARASWVSARLRQVFWRMLTRPILLTWVAGLFLLGLVANVLQIVSFFADSPRPLSPALQAPVFTIYQPDYDASGIPFDADSPLPCVHEQMKMWAEDSAGQSARGGSEFRHYLIAKEGDSPTQVREESTFTSGPAMDLAVPGVCTLILLRTPQPLSDEEVNRLQAGLDAVHSGTMSRGIILDWEGRSFIPVQRQNPGGRGMVDTSPNAHDTWASAVAGVLGSVHPLASFSGKSFIVLNTEECKDEPR